MKIKFIVYAFRNIFRHKSRNLLTGISIGLGTAAIIIGLAFSNGIIKQTIKGFTGTLVEDVMAFSPESAFEKHKSNRDISSQNKTKKNNSLIFRDVLFRNPTILKNYKETERSIREIDGIHYITKKVQFTGALFSEESSLNAMIVGMEPEGIRRKANLKIEHGRYLKENDSLSILLSEKLANRLQVGIGDKIAIVVNIPEGGTNAKDFNVEGIFSIRTGLEFVNHLIYISLRDAQDLMGLTDDEVFSLGIYLKNVDLVDYFEKKIKDKMKKEGNYSKIFSWKQVMEGILSQYYFIKYIVFVFTIVLVMIVVVGVINSVFLSMNERTKEIGTMMALGMKRKTLLFLLLLEGGILSVISTLAGCIIGSLISLFFENFGIAAPTKGAATLFGGKYLYAYLDYQSVLFSFFFVITITIISILYPISKASKMEPTKALGYI